MLIKENQLLQKFKEQNISYVPLLLYGPNEGLIRENYTKLKNVLRSQFMKKRQVFILLTTLFCLTSLKSFAEEIPYGIVSFPNCVAESKHGKQEQESFEKLHEKMTTLMSR